LALVVPQHQAGHPRCFQQLLFLAVELVVTLQLLVATEALEEVLEERTELLA
jgi:hypothetical protein